MKIQQETIFRCEFCDKPMFSKGAMSLHERQCKNNPKNKHKCFEYCIHLEKEHEEIRDEYGEVYSGGYSFHCKKLDKPLYSYKIERFKTNEKRKEGKERMPAECDSYEICDGHDDYVPGAVAIK